RQAIIVTFGPAVFDRRVAAFDEARFAQALAERGGIRGVPARRFAVEPADHRHRRLLRTRRERPRDCRAGERSQQFPPSDGDCHAPLPCEVREGNDTTPRACCPNSAAPGAGGAHAGPAATERRPAHDCGLISRDYFRPPRFTSSRTCETMCGRAVFSEGDAARPTTASQPPARMTDEQALPVKVGEAALEPVSASAALI